MVGVRLFCFFSVIVGLSKCSCPDESHPPGGILWQNCTRPNEHYACGSACQTTCETLGEPCPIVNIRCNDLCYCCPGFARDCKGKCVPEKDCPPKGTCPKASG